MRAFATTDPSNLSPEQRLADIASLLAEGVRRLHRRPHTPEIRGPDVTPEISAIPLELPADPLPDRGAVYAARKERVDAR